MLGLHYFYFGGKEMETLKEIEIPSSVIGIGSECFEKMTSLESIEIPTSVNVFGNILFLQ